MQYEAFEAFWEQLKKQEPGEDSAMAQKDSDLQKIKKLIGIMKDNDLVEVEIKHGDDKILLKRSQPQQPTVTAIPVIGQSVQAAAVGSGTTQALPASEQAAAEKDHDLIEIPSPMVGTYYAKPSPDSDPYVETGSPVNPQTIVCIIEAMKVMNEIKAETSGTIVEILVKTGQAVEYGQVLFRVKPD